MKEVLSQCDRSLIKGIGIDTTGSTPCLADAQGKPLAMQAEFAENPNAIFIDVNVLPIDAGSAYLVNESLYSVDTGLSLRTDSGKAEFI
jgi:sugar (pentulose or hexulose) kinase